MTTTAATEPNQLKGEDWAGEQGRKWLAHIDRFEGMIAATRGDLLALFTRHYREGEGVMMRNKVWLLSATA